jgi:rhamnogalacturonyl hydrolase YesR
MAVVIDLLPAERRAQRERLTGTTRQLLDGCIAHMRSDGLFHDIVDDPQSFVETNLSQMLAYTIYKGVRSGWLDRSYLQAADRMCSAALGKIDAWGLIQGACGSPTFDRPGTSTEAQAFFLMMEAAHDAVSS